MSEKKWCNCVACRELREAASLAAIDRRIRRGKIRDVAASIALAAWVTGCVFVWAKWLW